MRTDRNILIAFLLNLIFSIFEFFGGFAVGSIAIMSDSIHDFGDAISIGISYLLEKKSKRSKDNIYTYGYVRYSVLGSIITTALLFCSSCFVIVNAIQRVFMPTNVKYNEMVVFAIIGVVINFIAAKITMDNGSLNQKAVNIHMLEDLAGWVAVLIGAIIISVGNAFGWKHINMVDPLLSIFISTHIMISAFRHLAKSLNVFLEKAPNNLSALTIKEKVKSINGVIDAHHIHVWSLNGNVNCATMHVIVSANHAEIKKKIRETLSGIGIEHTTLELESKWEHCETRDCAIESNQQCGCGHAH